jgi:hypothetical protein
LYFFKVVLWATKPTILLLFEFFNFFKYLYFIIIIICIFLFTGEDKLQLLPPYENTIYGPQSRIDFQSY